MSTPPIIFISDLKTPYREDLETWLEEYGTEEQKKALKENCDLEISIEDIKPA